MERIAQALGAALSHRGRVVIHTDNGDAVTAALKRWAVRRNYDFSQVDVSSEPRLEMAEIMVWTNLHRASQTTQLQLVKMLDQLDNYNTNFSRLNPSDSCTVDGTVYTKPRLMAIVAVVETGETRPVVHQRLRHKFWFSQYADSADLEDIHDDDHKAAMLRVQAAVPGVHQSSEITHYIYSLVTFIRNHRLVTLAQTQVRVPTDVLDRVSDLAKTIVAIRHVDNPEAHFVTPEFCKLAVRCICYWLVDWEIPGGLFDLRDKRIDEDPDLEKRRQLVINMLAAEWYGSEWGYVREYIKEHMGHFDASSTTGYTNCIVEESIRLVKPPI